MILATDALVEAVKSRLFPLTVFESFLERLVERLPRCLIKVELKPADQVSVIDESKGEYKATGSTPRFVMKFFPNFPRGAWYYVEGALVRNNGSREAYICGEFGRGERKDITIPIPTNLRGTVREVFYLPADVTSLQWSPTAAPGFFSQSQLLVHKISVLESTLRQIYRVVNDLWRFRSRTPATRAGLTWFGAITNLHDAYRRTAICQIKRQVGNDYAAFISLNDTLTKAGIRAMQRQISQLSLRPVISLIMPVEAPEAVFLREALNSVSTQIYPHWELLLVCGASFNSQAQEIADEFQRKNAQVRIIPVKTGGTLVGALNDALALAQGEFVAKIGQNDKIPVHALFFVARELCKYPDADLIYTDDDDIDEAGKRQNPRFKPDWNQDLFYSCNYLTNLVIYRRERLLELGGYRLGFEGAEGYDLSLRYLMNTPTTKIRHIPRVLCHSRTISTPPSASSPLGEDNWKEWPGHLSGKRALAAHFEGSAIAIEDGSANGLYRIKHPLPEKLPLVSIVIPTRDRVDILDKCIVSIQEKTDYENWEILVVDNQSIEPRSHSYFEQVQRDVRIKVIHYGNQFNYSALNNFAAKHAQGEILALLNNDVEVITKDWLVEMVSHSLRPEVGAVGAKLFYENGMVQHAGVIIGLGGVAGHAHKYLKRDEQGYCHRAVITQNLSAVTGACLVVRKKCYQEVGGLNEDHLAVAFNDIDFCLKLNAAGYRNVFTPYAQLYHHESISRGHVDTPEKRSQFVREFEYMKNRWGSTLLRDAAYNPNLTLEFEDFSLSRMVV